MTGLSGISFSIWLKSGCSLHGERVAPAMIRAWCHCIRTQTQNALPSRLRPEKIRASQLINRLHKRAFGPSFAAAVAKKSNGGSWTQELTMAIFGVSFFDEVLQTLGWLSRETRRYSCVLLSLAPDRLARR